MKKTIEEWTPLNQIIIDQKMHTEVLKSNLKEYREKTRLATKKLNAIIEARKVYLKILED